LQGHQDSVQDIDFNPQGTLLASCSVDLSVKLWNFEDNEYACRKTLQGHDHSVSAVAWLPAGDFLLSGSRDKSIKLWEVATGYCVRTFSGHDQWVRGLAVHPSGLTFVSASMDQSLRMWTIKTGELVRTLKDHEHVVEVCVFSNPLADSFINASRIEEAKTNGTPIPQLNGLIPASSAASSSASASSAAASSSSAAAAPALGGQYLASGSRDRSVRIWEVSTGLCVKVLNAHDNCQ
jgi:platelet-activating factor acetylhydrolase IB subunit alpha